MAPLPRIAIEGNPRIDNTAKDQLRAIGGRWNAKWQTWVVPADKEDEARQLLRTAPSECKPADHDWQRTGHLMERCVICGAINNGWHRETSYS